MSSKEEEFREIVRGENEEIDENVEEGEREGEGYGDGDGDGDGKEEQEQEQEQEKEEEPMQSVKHEPKEFIEETRAAEDRRQSGKKRGKHKCEEHARRLKKKRRELDVADARGNSDHSRQDDNVRSGSDGDAKAKNDIDDVSILETQVPPVLGKFEGDDGLVAFFTMLRRQDRLLRSCGLVDGVVVRRLQSESDIVQCIVGVENELFMLAQRQKSLGL